MHNKKSQLGFFLIEVVVASAVIGTVLIYMISTINGSVDVSKRALERTQASYLLEEGVEVTKGVRDNGWSGIAAVTLGTSYYTVWTGSSWTLSSTPQTIGGFTRTIVFSAVSRDGNSDIVATGGTIDTGTKKGVVAVSWNTPTGPRTERVTFYISDIRS
jgi:type II secretory pathway pseudopilin PulG